MAKENEETIELGEKKNLRKFYQSVMKWRNLKVKRMI